jgi:hypothetical protein
VFGGCMWVLCTKKLSILQCIIFFTFVSVFLMLYITDAHPEPKGNDGDVKDLWSSIDVNSEWSCNSTHPVAKPFCQMQKIYAEQLPLSLRTKRYVEWYDKASLIRTTEFNKKLEEAFKLFFSIESSATFCEKVSDLQATVKSCTEVSQKQLLIQNRTIFALFVGLICSCVDTYFKSCVVQIVADEEPEEPVLSAVLEKDSEQDGCQPPQNFRPAPQAPREAVPSKNGKDALFSHVSSAQDENGKKPEHGPKKHATAEKGKQSGKRKSAARSAMPVVGVLIVPEAIKRPREIEGGDEWEPNKVQAV